MKDRRKICIYLLDTMADHELGYFQQVMTLQNMLPEQKYDILYVAKSKEVVKTASGMTIVPDCALIDVDEEKMEALILPGGDTWLNPDQRNVLDLAVRLFHKGKVVAAICGATLGLAQIGILDKHKHTSNTLGFLTCMSEKYHGRNQYVNEPAVATKNLITAGSAGSLLWAKYIAEGLDLYAKETVEAWYMYFATGDASYFNEMMETFK